MRVVIDMQNVESAMDRLDLVGDAPAWSLPAGLAIVVGLLLAIAIGSALRFVPDGERVVVSRLGRARRVVGPGLVRRVPLLETWRAVIMQPSHVPVGVSATSLDGVPVHVRAVVASEVVDPMLICGAHPDPSVAVQVEVESELSQAVSRLDVSELLPSRPALEDTLRESLTARVSAWGMRISSVEVTEIEVRLTMALIESLRHPKAGTG